MLRVLRLLLYLLLIYPALLLYTLLGLSVRFQTQMRAMTHLELICRSRIDGVVTLPHLIYFLHYEYSDALHSARAGVCLCY